MHFLKMREGSFYDNISIEFYQQSHFASVVGCYVASPSFAKVYQKQDLSGITKYSCAKRDLFIQVAVDNGQCQACNKELIKLYEKKNCQASALLEKKLVCE